MKSRMAITATLVFGALFSTTGAGLAVSGLVEGRSAQDVQYPQEVEQADVLGEVGEVEESAPAPAPAPTAAPQAAAAPRQVAATTENSLPFTGFSAVPVLLLGIALLAGGLMLRRRTNAAPGQQS